jgi:hypothetical protein
MIAFHPTQQYVLLRASASTGTVTNDTVNIEAPINWFYKGVYLLLDRTAETGTCTLNAKVQFYMPASGLWQDLEGASWVEFADAAVADRYLHIYPGITSDESDSNLALDTNEGVVCGQYLPRRWRVAVTTGGTSVENTFSLEALMLP